MIIGLTGKARSGKDTVAEHICSTCFFEHYWFSKPMKDACAAMFNWDERHLYGELKEVVDPRFGVSPRVAVQTLGTEWGRDTINQNIWIERARIEMESFSDLVISDCRFNNEAEAIREAGGVIVEVVRPNVQQVAEHASEKGIDASLIDFTIVNDGTLTDLYRAVDQFLIKHQKAA